MIPLGDPTDYVFAVECVEGANALDEALNRRAAKGWQPYTLMADWARDPAFDRFTIVFFAPKRLFPRIGSPPR